MPVTSGQEGGCQCGAIRYRLLRDPAALYACHCLDCQKQSLIAHRRRRRHVEHAPRSRIMPELAHLSIADNFCNSDIKSE